MERAIKWRKNDGTNINDIDEASVVAGRWDKTVPKKIYTADFYKSSLNHPILKDRELTRKMSPSEYEKLIDSLNLENIYYETVKQEYFDPLLSKLKLVQK
jgi:hypothetical protein